MPKKISFIVTNSGTINAVANGKSYTVPRDHANYAAVKDALAKDDADSFDKLVNVAKAVETFTAPATPVGGKVTVRDGEVFWGDERMHNAITDRILGLMRDGFPFDPMLRFLENLMSNPSRRAVQELYTFLDRQGLPITEDGCFLGYKRVNEDYTDCHTGTVSNVVGTVVSMPRNEVDDEWRNLCSSGFHVGSIEYVRNFNSGKRVVIVKVNPADVVAVPEREQTKLRTCKYEVVSEYDRALIDPMPGSLYTAEGTQATPPPPAPFNPVNDDDDLDDEDDSVLDEDEYDDEYDDEDEDDSVLDDEPVDVRTRLTDKAEAKGANPKLLAFELGLDKDDLPDNPTVANVVTQALVDQYDFDVERVIDRL